MILKTPNGKSVRVFFLTRDMQEVLVRQSIRFNDVFNLVSYHQKLTFSEIACMLKFQYTVAQQMGVPLVDPKHLFGEGYNGGMVEAAFNAIDGETLSTYYKASSRFKCLDAGMEIVIVLFNGEDSSKVPGWDSLESTTFSGALLETLFAKVGFLDCHNGKIPKPRLGEFTLAEVYKLVSIENP